jgi:hypothetical protein
VESDDRIIQQFNEHISETVEASHEVFGGLPVCPFARTARLDGKITYIIVKDLNIFSKTIFEHVERWSETQSQVLILICPYGEYTYQYVDFVASVLTEYYREEYEFFAGYPESEYRFQGVLTRRDAYANLQCNRAADLAEAREILLRSKYYDERTTAQSQTG